ncbi:hypothetical protein DXX93_16750 [Thalassotalea euphylliae]|uniref:DUF3718 domain-containing protein n=1 Tax=Thalassotalea euphylliae TaxID=1655234 RepID=A0A3E0TUK0_9GAMM|nr:hypothetical protein [Thalassotalea euphylliae]REL28047.1 hypothetical protein DXX93_16750 [Thalassotalea euphylliae]
MKILYFCVMSAFALSMQAHAQDQKGQFETDFDHRVQFKLVKQTDKQYHLEVARLGGVSFERMNLFTTRKAKRICGDMGYSIKYLEGVESFDDRNAKPNYIFPSLTVEISCP